MIKVDLTYIYEISKILSDIKNITDKKEPEDIIGYLGFAKEAIEGLMTNSIYTKYLSTCQRTAKHFLDFLSAFSKSKEKSLSPEETSQLAWSAYEFEISLKSALTSSPVYIITPKCGYDVDILTELPSEAFPNSLLQLVPEVEYDVEQAGRCLAFEAPTAVAFHLHRINEAVVHRYWNAHTNGNSPLEKSSIGNYLSKMRSDQYKHLFDEKILSTLEQINKLHRNPVLHPQENLTPQDAISLFGIIVSVVDFMLSSISSRQDSQPEEHLQN